jgi:hypothetical protein
MSATTGTFRITRRGLTGLTALLFAVAAFPARAAEGEIGFVEEFAIAPDRAKAIERLIPGTEDFYFYSSLHAQNSGRLDEVDRLLEAWIGRFGRTAQVIEIENRQALLRYDADPAASLDFLRRRLGLRFNHQREDAARDVSLPSRLDPALIAWAALSARALQWHDGTMNGFEDSALERMAGTELDARRRRDLLRRLARPDVDGLVNLVPADLRERDSGGFGSLPIHQALLDDQLAELARQLPQIADQSAFVNARLLRLLPSDDADWTADAAEREAYLDRLETYVRGLSDAHRSLKAHVLYHRLVHDRADGTFNRARFIDYLRLPRPVRYMNAAFLRRASSGASVDLGQSFAPHTPFPPIHDDERLVRDYLAHFFLTDENVDAFSDYVDDAYLKELFAETKIVNGLGDMEQWASWLPPARYQALRDRVDLEFLPSNRTHFDPGDSVTLKLAVKNVSSLLVKVFEIDTPGYYRENTEEIGTDINLDGLIAHEETVHTYDDPPLRRIVHTFEFPALKDRGVYVVEFIGNGISSRALIRKGRLHHVERVGSAGHVFTVFDEANRPVPDASIWLAGREYRPDDDGEIVIPFTSEPGQRRIVLTHQDFATLGRFTHHDEAYTLDAGFYVDREALLSRALATVLVRPSADPWPDARPFAHRGRKARHHHHRPRRRRHHPRDPRLRTP